MSASEPTVQAKARLMLALVKQLAALEEEIPSYDQEIHTLFFAHPDHLIFGSLPGAGLRLVSRLLAEWGDDRSRYLSVDGICVLAGASPVLRQSGKFRGIHTRYACIKPFRDAGYRLAWSSIRWEPWAGEYYQRKRAEGKSHTMAVRALSRVWLQIIYRMWMNHTPYQHDTFFRAQAAHRVA